MRGRPVAVDSSATRPLALWVDGGHDARANMARDAALLARCAAGRLVGPLMRLFTFAPAGLTLGRAQDPATELDLAALQRLGPCAQHRRSFAPVRLLLDQARLFRDGAGG